MNQDARIDNFRIKTVSAKGAANLAIATLQHALMPFAVRKDINERQIFEAYKTRKAFISFGKLLPMTVDVMEYDLEKVKDTMLSVLQKNYQFALYAIKNKTFR